MTSQSITTDAPDPNERRSTVAGRLPVAIVMLTIMFVTFVRCRIADTPLERDEGEFAYVGQLIRHGEVPYKSLHVIKLPGTHVMYAISMTLFGETPTGIHLGLLCANIASIVLIYLIGKKFSSAVTGAIASVIFALLTIDPALYGFAAHSTHFVALFALTGIYFLLRAMDSASRIDAVLCGLSMGVSFLCKQPALAFAAMAFGFLVWTAVTRGKRAVPFYYAIGWIVPYAITCATMIFAGAFGVFWTWTVKYAAAHSHPIYDIIPALKSTWNASPPRILLIAFIFPVALWFVCVRKNLQPWNRIFVLAFAVSGAAAVSAGFYFYLHYFIMLVPAIALTVALAISELSAIWKQSFERSGEMNPSVAMIVPAAVTALWALCVIGALADYFFTLSPDVIIGRRYPGNPFLQTRVLGEYLSTHSPTNARVAVLLSESEMLFYAHRRSASRFISAYELTTPSKSRFEIEEQFKRELLDADPDYVVFVCAPLAWAAQDHAGLALADWCYAFPQHNYTRIAVADGLAPDLADTIFKWDDEARTYKRQYPTFIEVYRRNR